MASSKQPGPVRPRGHGAPCAPRRQDLTLTRIDESAELVERGRPIPAGRNRRRDRARAISIARDRSTSRPAGTRAQLLPRRRTADSRAPSRYGRYSASLGGAYLSDGEPTWGSRRRLAVDVDSRRRRRRGRARGLVTARLGPRFRLTARVSDLVFDESHEAGGFRDSVGVRWSRSAWRPSRSQSATPTWLIETPVSLVRPGRLGCPVRLRADEGLDFSDGDNADFFAFAAGAEVMLDRRNGVRAAYVRWDDFERDGISANVFSLSYIRRLGGGE